MTHPSKIRSLKPAIHAGPKIGLLGGSFNPAHDGHREISTVAIERLSLDAVWWLVSPGNPSKDPAAYTDYETRCDVAQKVANHPRIQISRYEADHGLRYTIDTLRRLLVDYPQTDFVWLMGADNLAQFHQWRDWQEIAQTVPLAVMNRPGYREHALASPAAKNLAPYQLDKAQSDALWQTPPPAWVFISQPENPNSSTALRSAASDAPITAEKKLTKTTNQRAFDTGAQDIEPLPSITRDDDLLSFIVDYHPAQNDFCSDVIAGLSKPQKSLSPKYFYDETGSELFTQITRTADYYPTRTELSLLRRHMPDIAKAIGDDAAIFEYGSGASEKIRLLIDNLKTMHTYVAMDISKEYLLDSARSIARDYPGLSVSAVCADFAMALRLPAEFHPDVKRWTGYFPGSTIGNFSPGAAVPFLGRISDTMGAQAQFLLGFDLIKDKAILERAYNDREGVTALFNLNLIKRMARELGARVKPEDFEHCAFYNETEHRIEMHLRAVRSTQIIVGEHEFTFAKNETLHTEYSYKYTREIMIDMLESSPWAMSHFWTDDQRNFGLCLLRN